MSSKILSLQILAVVLSSVVLSLVGCTGGGPAGPEQLPTVPAAGTVTYQGSPIANADVSFQHSEGKVTATAKTGSDGRFALKSYGEKEGAPAGKYTLTVSVSGAQEIEPGVLAPEPPGGFKSPIPAKFGSTTTSGLSLEIPPAGSTDLKVELK
ncbi:carboxypeptidase-like regulatory domain-containing protein [Anatilimnocola sp. NA78]|uniref:carboxypeptidase-like regulatory domain-containing protein n=1 Tax=Anatilimnocola sp. NA78 TaxID=3415683 RepID=UPI003CE58420